MEQALLSKRTGAFQRATGRCLYQCRIMVFSFLFQAFFDIGLMALFVKGVSRGKKVVFDLDNTIADEFGKKLRPGIKGLLSILKKDYKIYLWTNSMRERARLILDEHSLFIYFDKVIFREDYDPDNRGIAKDLRRIDAAFLIDDDPAEIEYNKRNKIGTYLITPFRSSFDVTAPDDDPHVVQVKSELKEIYRVITKG